MARAQAADKGEGAGRAMRGGTGRAAATPPARDETYGLVSVLYHALQGSETYATYVDDARRAGDDELVSFFEECCEQENERALMAKQLLAMRLADEEDEEDEDEDSDEE